MATGQTSSNISGSNNNGDSDNDTDYDTNAQSHNSVACRDSSMCTSTAITSHSETKAPPTALLAKKIRRTGVRAVDKPVVLVRFSLNCAHFSLLFL